jgi:hypothetical protein
MKTLRLALLLSLVVSCDCSVDEPGPRCPPTFVYDEDEGACVSEDLGTPDDADTDMPGDPCGGCGTDEVCDTGTMTCVACLGDGDCGDDVCLVDATDSSMNACVDCRDGDDCGGDTPVCTSDNTCVGCEADADCTDPANGQCDTGTNTCVPCDDSAQCTEDGAGVCDDGMCVECTIATEETDCGDFSCNPATQECTTTDRGSVTRCGECLGDSECIADHKCIELDYMGAARAGYCLLELPGSEVCPDGYKSTLDAESLSGLPSATYCAIDTSSTTCEARLAVGEDCSTVTCPEGGLCETITGLGEVCTISCSTTSNCPGDPYDPCASGYCGS